MQSTTHRVRSLIFLLGSSFALATLLVAFLIHQFGPSGRYQAGLVLISPEVIETINLVPVKKTNFAQKWRFNPLEFSFYDENLKQMRKEPISLKNYQKFYQLIANEKSLVNSQQYAALFAGLHPMTLTLSIDSTATKGQTQSQPLFQIVQFNENYFRVQLQNTEKQGDWAYFQYPNIDIEIQKLLMSSHE